MLKWDIHVLTKDKTLVIIDIPRGGAFDRFVKMLTKRGVCEKAPLLFLIKDRIL